jgi:hypothetical protein
VVASTNTSEVNRQITCSQSGTEKASNFLANATALINRGLSVIPVQPRAKAPLAGALSRTTDPTKIAQWAELYPDANVGIVSDERFTILETDNKPELRRLVRDITGAELPATLTLSSGRPNRCAYIFKRTPACGDECLELPGTYEFRNKNQYVVGPGSLHPEGRTYHWSHDVPIVAMPDSLMRVLKLLDSGYKGTTVSEHVKTGPFVALKDAYIYDANPEDMLKLDLRIRENERHYTLMSLGGMLHDGQRTAEEIAEILFRIRDKFCDDPASKPDSEVVRISEWAHKKGPFEFEPINISSWAIGTIAFASEEDMLQYAREHRSDYRISVEKVEPILLDVDGNPVLYDRSKTAENGDMPAEVLTGRLREIAEGDMGHFPMAYAAPSLLATASAMMPHTVEDHGDRLVVGRSMLNLFVALVGPVNTGKTQADEWSRGLLGIAGSNISEAKAGSSEALVRKFAKMRTDGKLGENVLIALDEWSYFFAKAGIQNSAFVGLLTSAFYKRELEILSGGGKDLKLNCGLSFTGGIVADQFETCFGSESLGGLYDRFLFGLCPDGYRHNYRPFTGPRLSVTPIPVSVNMELYELANELKQAHTELTREPELALRAAQICAAVDGQPVVDSRYAGMIRAMTLEQARLRTILTPNGGETIDAKIASAILSWMRRNLKDGQWVNGRDLKRGIHRTVEKLGPNAYGWALKGLSESGSVETKELPAGPRGLLTVSRSKSRGAIGAPTVPQPPYPLIIRVLLDFDTYKSAPGAVTSCGSVATPVMAPALVPQPTPSKTVPVEPVGGPTSVEPAEPGAT